MRAKAWIVQISDDAMYLSLVETSRPHYRKEQEHGFFYHEYLVYAQVSSAAVHKALVHFRKEERDNRDLGFGQGPFYAAVMRAGKTEVRNWKGKVVR